MKKLQFFNVHPLRTYSDYKLTIKNSNFKLLRLFPLDRLIMEAINIVRTQKSPWKVDKHTLYLKIRNSPLAMKAVLNCKDLGAVQSWLKRQLNTPTPIWSIHWSQPIRKAWAEQMLLNPSLSPEDREEFVDLEICGLKLDAKLGYQFNPSRQIAIWFSTNPRIAIREKEKDRLLSREAIDDNIQNTLIYSSKILDSLAKENMKDLSRNENVSLIDIDNLELNLSETSSLLLYLSQKELFLIGKGGNPAAASDLIRWIPEIMKGSVYADIDLPIDTDKQKKVLSKPRAGLPVVFNMGSKVSTSLPSYQKIEVCAINTDIIAYSSHVSTSAFMRKIAKEIIEAYKNPFKVLSDCQAPICNTQAFKEMQKNPNSNIFDMRRATSDCSSLKDFYYFLGEELFLKTFKFNGAVVEQVLLCIKSQKDIPDAIAKKPEYLEQMQGLRAYYYKALVEEISGPGAVYRAIGGAKVLFNSRYRKDCYLPISAARALEGFACVNEMTNFVSDNIPPWQASEEVLKDKAFNEEGLSWIPTNSL